MHISTYSNKFAKSQILLPCKPLTPGEVARKEPERVMKNPQNERNTYFYAESRRKSVF
jgi:hypothetical protein